MQLVVSPLGMPEMVAISVKSWHQFSSVKVVFIWKTVREI